MNKEYIKNFRNALKVFVLTKFNYRIDNGEYDNLIGRFLDGDSLNINMNIELLANDVIIMRYLSEGKIDKKILNKVINLWKRKNK